MFDLLPIGSIVKLKNGKTKLMIIGYCKNIKEDKIKENDYVACIYPLGIVSMKNLLAFKKEQINEVIVLGSKSNEFETLKKILKNT